VDRRTAPDADAAFPSSSRASDARVRGRLLFLADSEALIMIHPRSLLLAALFVLPVVLPTGAAFAHAHLQSALPAVDGVVEKAPTAITINFTEALEPRFCSIEVTDAQGQRVDDGTAHTDGDPKRLSIGLKTLPSGIYTVQWHATSVDTHRTEGNYHFTVK
jgi:hypothetical protein